MIRPPPTSTLFPYTTLFRSRKATDVSEVLATSVEAATAECASKNISVKKDFAPGPWPIQGDSTRLRQCFDNLLRNAVERSEEHTSELQSLRHLVCRLLLEKK